ncbi:MAG: hypothetical protein HC816_09635 [Leptolyngbyaceae cyanobacterium RM1_1_2]|nr:hypothetical protein [Leptolyngbyaceae cyanobacterium RM1_1_2]
MPEPRSLDFRLVQRICDLQQALDQALDSLENLQIRVATQHLVESQLIKTEHFANAQQQVITHLQTQLKRKQQWQQQLLHQFVNQAEQWMEKQQEQLQKLKIRTQQSEIEIQSYLVRLQKHCQSDSFTAILSQRPRVELESEIFVARMLTVSLGTHLQAIQQHTQTLETVFKSYQSALVQLESSLEPSGDLSISASPDEAIAPNQPPDQPLDAQANTALFELFHDLKLKQRKIDVLEVELARQSRLQIQSKHQCQAIAAERDHYRHQLQQAEAQVAALQEHILQQASQALECEVKIQFWKEQSEGDRPRLPALLKPGSSAEVNR